MKSYYVALLLDGLHVDGASFRAKTADEARRLCQVWLVQVGRSERWTVGTARPASTR